MYKIKSEAQLHAACKKITLNIQLEKVEVK